MQTLKNQKSQLTRTLIVVAIMLLIAIIHVFRLGNLLPDKLNILYYSYFSDIIIPLGVYFLLCVNEISIKFLRSWKNKVILIFLMTSFAEVLQGFSYYFLGSTFDYYDFIAYALGLFIAVIVDKFLFRKYIPNWNYDK